MAEPTALRTVALGAALACGLLLLSCSGGGGSSDTAGSEVPGTSTSATTPATTSTSVAPTTTRPLTAAERIAAATPVDPADFHAADFGGGLKEELYGVYFTTPSGNITCTWPGEDGDPSSDEVLCGLQSRDDPAPEPADGCGPLSWHENVVGYGRRRGLEDGLCSSGVLAPPGANVLPYGSALTAGGYSCLSAEDGVTCIDTGAGTGFFVSRSELVAVG